MGRLPQDEESAVPGDPEHAPGLQWFVDSWPLQEGVGEHDAG